MRTPTSSMPPPDTARAPAMALAARIDWGAIIAGALLASTISFVLFIVGSALGLSLTSPYEGEGISRTGMAIAAALWVLWVTASSFMAGGYLTGRIRRGVHQPGSAETEIDDGAHGLVVWALGVMFGAVTAAAIGLGAAQMTVTAGATAAASAAASSQGKMQTTVDLLFRPKAGASGAQPPSPDSVNAEAVRLLTAAPTTGVREDDKAYLAQLVAQRTGMSAQDARTQVDQVLGKVKAAADKARKTTILAAFLLAASLLAGAAAAAWAATEGGSHRDRSLYMDIFRWR